MKEHAWKLTPAGRADAHQIPRTHFVWSVGHRRYLRRVRFRIVHIAGRREIRSEGLDAFQTANELAEMSGLSSSRFDVTVVGVRKHVKTSQGFTVAARWARTRLAQGFSLDEAAKAVAASKRTLARRLHAVLGKSPLSYFQTLRVERAVHLLKTGNESVEEIAARVGYADGVTLRTLLRRHLGYGIREIRKAS